MFAVLKREEKKRGFQKRRKQTKERKRKKKERKEKKEADDGLEVDGPGPVILQARKPKHQPFRLSSLKTFLKHGDVHLASTSPNHGA